MMGCNNTANHPNSKHILQVIPIRESKINSTFSFVEGLEKGFLCVSVLVSVQT